MVSCVAFGLSESFEFAMATRFAWGMLNGNVGVAKTALSELCDDTNSAKAFSFIGLNTGFGRIIGPAIGGLLSEPVRKYPALFGSSALLARFPFLLPCLVAAVMTGVTFIMTYFLLEETQHLSLAEAKANRAAVAAAAAATADGEATPMKPCAEGKGGEVVAPAPPEEVESTAAGMVRLARDRPVAISCAVYSALGLVGLVSNELFPLYVLNDATHGGFGWDAQMVGLSGFASGPFLVLFQAFGYDKLVRSVGLIPVLRYSLGMFALLLALQPMASLTLGLPWDVTNSLLFVHQIFTNVTRVTAFICVFVIVANSSKPEDRGRVNGLGQAAVSAVRACGPPIATAAFALSVGPAATAAGWPVNYYATWYAMAAMAGGTLYLTFALPPWIGGKRPALEGAAAPQPSAAAKAVAAAKAAAERPPAEAAATANDTAITLSSEEAEDEEVEREPLIPGK
jgi:hypothetical protein